jgi:hypothetical protein
MSWIDEIVADRPKASMIAWSGEFEFAGAAETDGGGRTVKFRLVHRPEDHFKAHPFAKFTRRRGKSAGSRFDASIVEVSKPDDPPIYAGEVMLLGWADGPSGATVNFALEPEGNIHPFLSCTRVTRGAPGTRFMAVLAERGDDDMIVDQELADRQEAAAKQTEKPQEPSKAKPSNEVTLWLKNPRLHDWLSETEREDTWSFEKADAWLKKKLGIGSKTEFDRGDEHAVFLMRKFNKIRFAFSAWIEDIDGKFRG